jgi:hypothetical protein
MYRGQAFERGADENDESSMEGEENEPRNAEYDG